MSRRKRQDENPWSGLRERRRQLWEGGGQDAWVNDRPHWGHGFGDDDYRTEHESFSERYEGLGGRGWREGLDDAMHRQEGQYAGLGPRGYRRSDARIEEDINER